MSATHTEMSSRHTEMWPEDDPSALYDAITQPRQPNEDALRRPLLWKSMLLETAWKPRTFPTCLWTGCVFRWKKHSKKENLKTGMLLGSSFFDEKASQKKLFLDGHHDLKLSRPRGPGRSPELSERPCGVGDRWWWCDDDTMIYISRLLTSWRTLIAKAIRE